MKNKYALRIKQKYNPKQVKAFQAKDAEKRFLEPLNISFHTTDFREFSNNDELLTRDEEFNFFAALHFIKYKLDRAKKKNTAKRYSDIYIAIRNRIISANMRLVFNCVNKYMEHFPAHEYSRLQSNGTMILMYCVDGFDPWKGFRFCTYAYRPIVSSFFSQQKKELKLSSIDYEDVLKYTPASSKIDGDTALSIERVQIALQKCPLNAREKAILYYRFPPHDAKNLTLKKVAQRIGITKERIRQVQQEALQKLREYMKDDPHVKHLVH